MINVCTPNLKFSNIGTYCKEATQFKDFFFNNCSLYADIDPMSAYNEQLFIVSIRPKGLIGNGVISRSTADYPSCSTVCFLIDRREKNNGQELLHRREMEAPSTRL